MFGAMRLAVFIMLVLGVGIGSIMPNPRPRASVAAAPPLAAPAVATEPPRETVLERSDAGHFLAVADVNRMPVRFVVDTGADTVALTVEDAERAGVRFDRSQFTVVGLGAGGPVRGQEVTIDEIVLDGKRASGVQGVVLEGANVSLLGHSYLRELASVSIEGDRMRLR